MSATEKTVPKFSSFRPKAPPGQKPSATTAKRERSPESHDRIKRRKSPHLDDRRSSRHGHRRSHSHSQSQSRRHDSDSKGHHSRHHRDRHHSRHHRDRHTSREQKQKPPEEPAPVVSHDPDLYVVDTKGDPQNVAYQRLHKYSIPPYRRIAYGNVLGLHSRLKIDQLESSDDKVYLVDKSLSSKDRPQRLLLKRQKVQDLPVLRSRPEDALDPDQDFVALASEEDQQRRLSISSDDDASHYKHLDRPKAINAIPPLSIDQKLLPSSDPDLEARQTNAELFRDTKADPSSLQPWLRLAAHQQYLVRPGVDAQYLTNHERQTLADMRIDIYEKALRSVLATDAPSKERLILELLEEASLVWEPQKYLQKLQDILQQHPTSFPLWTKYLAAAQTNPIGFRFEDAKSFFLRCLETIKASTRPGHVSDTQAMTLYLILRYTAFLSDTGYDELSIAIWQALCEFHFFRPSDLSNADSHLLASFEDFWESESPRFGENGAKGWCAFSEDNGVLSELDQPASTESITSSLPFKSFSTLEERACHAMRFPGRTLDENGPDDPFHVVFFSDIKEVIQATSNGFDRRDFLDSILCYLGLPPIQIDTSSSDGSHLSHAWRSDIFLDHGLLRNEPNDTLEGYHVQQYQMSSDLLFSHAFEHLSSNEAQDNLYAFAKRALAGLVQLFHEDEMLAEYYLAFVHFFFPHEASKIAKSILKRRPSSVRLYNACALIESKLGRQDKATQIWSGAINMKESFPAASQQELVLLWQNLIWSDLENNQLPRALSRLTYFGGNLDPQAGATASISTAALLRIRRAFKDGFVHSLSQSQQYLAALNVELLALTAYLTESESLQAPVDVLRGYCDTIMQTLSMPHKYAMSQQSDGPSADRHVHSSRNSMLLELLHQVKAGIISHHIRTKRPYRPAFVRAELESSISLFPNNTLFLGLYRDNEARFRIDDRVRSILKSTVLTNEQSPVVGWVFAIDQELFRYTSQASGSTADSVRATFNRALLTTGSAVKHSKTLWMKWFQFEAHVALKQSSGPLPIRKKTNAVPQHLQKLKQVFLSGLHHLPWLKSWILLGLKAFDTGDESGWDVRELRRLYNVLVERELRIRVEGLEDVLDNSMED